jgi:hypothetical protein
MKFNTNTTNPSNATTNYRQENIVKNIRANANVPSLHSGGHTNQTSTILMIDWRNAKPYFINAHNCLTAYALIPPK